MFYINIGGQIYKYRSQLGLSQEELGNKLNVTVETVNSWEANEAEPSLENLKNLATIFEITLDQLFANDAEEKDILVEKTKNALYEATTIYSREAFFKMYKITAKREIFLGIFFTTLYLILFIWFLVRGNIVWICITLFFLIFFGYRLFKIIFGANKAVDKLMETDSNRETNYYFHDDGILIIVKSETTKGKGFKNYSDIRRILQDKEYLYLIFVGGYHVIDKNNCSVNSDELIKFIKDKKRMKKN